MDIMANDLKFYYFIFHHKKSNSKLIKKLCHNSLKKAKTLRNDKKLDKSRCYSR